MGDQNRLYQLSAIVELDDAFAAPRALTEDHHLIAQITPSELVDEGLPCVLIVISNFKSYWLGKLPRHIRVLRAGILGRVLLPPEPQPLEKPNPQPLVKSVRYSPTDFYEGLWLVNNHKI
jgi:hypothetical protein